MGWAIMIAVLLLTLAALWRWGGGTRQDVEFGGAALLLALVGYIFMGSPGQAGSPTEPRGAKAAGMSPQDVRKMEANQFSSEGNLLMLTDALIRAGATRQAVDMFKDATDKDPKNAEIWVGMGNALIVHGGGMVNPAAEFAFQKAAEISPNHPGPPFFMGLALAQSGKLEEAGEVWRALLARAPAGAPWTEDLKGRLAEIDQMTAAPAK